MAPQDETTTPKGGRITDEEVAMQVQSFMDTWEFKIMSSTLGKTWKHPQVVSSALEILALNGVPMEKADIDLYAQMEQSLMIPLLTDKIPLELRDNFELLASQLYIMLNTATSVCSAVDKKGAGNLTEIMEESADSNKMVQLLLKKAVVQASKEAAKLQRCGQTWTSGVERRLDALAKASLYAEEARQRLAATELQLQEYTMDSKAKSKQALLGLASGNEAALVKNVWGLWLGETQANKDRRNLVDKYEKEMEAAEAELFKYQEKQLEGVRNMMMTKIRDTDRGLKDFCISTWYDVVVRMKQEGDQKAQVEEMQAKLKAFQGEAKAKQMAVFGRLAGDRDQAVIVLAMSSWINFHQDYAREKEFEEQAKAAQLALENHLKGKKDDTKRLLDKMSAATDSGLLAQMIGLWKVAAEDEKKARKLEEEMKTQDVRLKQMLANSKGKAMGVAGRTNEQINENLLLRVLNAWAIEFKVNHVEKYYQKKIAGKRQQLTKVHTLFKDFADQLESGLRAQDGDSSGRTGTTRKTRGMSKGDGSVSLPDIHARAPMVA